MRYVVPVVIVFDAGEGGTKIFDIWENIVGISTESPSEALKDAMRLTKDVFSRASSWRALGYTGRPVLYAVKSVHTEPVLMDQSDQDYKCMLLTKVDSVDEKELQMLQRFEKIPRQYSFMHIEPS